ncbi:MAG: MbtH domain protein [Stigonema ocellatum SAG 48.90 = DSM 106950]|nr:MbtH domain protein [Stigonema ocellatum SAG 48.90 = DSM 106950]
MNELVQRLSQGDHPVEASLKPEKTVAAFKESIDRGYVHIKFTNTQGGTELGVRLDQQTSNLNEADFEHQVGKVHLVGNLTLNYVKVRCIADINLETLEGKGHLEPVEGA